MATAPLTIQIIQLVLGLSPVALQLIAALTQSLSGKTDAEILALEGPAWDAMIEKAKAEIAAAQPPTP
jgi:hypothetical protein